MVDEGMVAIIVPSDVLVIEPILTGLSKLPKVSLSCAVKVLPITKLLPLCKVNGTVSVSPAQIFVLTFPVKILVIQMSLVAGPPVAQALSG